MGGLRLLEQEWRCAFLTTLLSLISHRRALHAMRSLTGEYQSGNECVKW